MAEITLKVNTDTQRNVLVRVTNRDTGEVLWYQHIRTGVEYHLCSIPIHDKQVVPVLINIRGTGLKPIKHTMDVSHLGGYMETYMFPDTLYKEKMDVVCTAPDDVDSDVDLDAHLDVKPKEDKDQPLWWDAHLK